MLVIIRSTSQN